MLGGLDVAELTISHLSKLFLDLLQLLSTSIILLGEVDLVLPAVSAFRFYFLICLVAVVYRV